MSNTMTRWLIATMLLWPSILFGGQSLATEAPSISFSPLRMVTEEDRFGNPKEITEFTATVQLVEKAEPQEFLVRAPDVVLSLDEQPRGEIVEDRLLITTNVLVVVFDLETGEQVLEVVAGAQVAVAENGRLVAFETLQRRFLPREATSSVIQVLHVPTLQIQPVFPERSIIKPSQFGRLLAWVEELADRHSAGRLFISPDGSWLLFFCKHRILEPDVPQEVYLVVVDLSRGLDESHFIHRPFDWKVHIRPEAEVGDRRTYFAIESLTWRDNDTVVVTPPRYASWLKDEVVIELPDPDDLPALANPSKDKEP